MHKKGLSTGVIIAIVIVVLLVIVGFFIYSQNSDSTSTSSGAGDSEFSELSSDDDVFGAMDSSSGDDYLG